MAENKGVVLYDNVLKHDGISIAETAASISGFEFTNAIDWRDFSLFRVASGTTNTIDATVAQDELIDAVGVYVRSYTGTGNNNITVQYESSAGVFTTLVDYVGVGGKLSLNLFSQVTVLAGRRIRFICSAGTADFDIRQIAIGQRLEFQRGQWDGVTPYNFDQSVIADSTVSVNGSILGRSLIRVERSATIDLSYVKNDWMRQYWQPFQVAAAKHAFFYQWSQIYPLEVAFATALKLDAPTQMAQDHMNVTMPLRCLISDNNVI